MSVSDIPRAFREDTHVLLLFPSVVHGYLFYVTGNIWYIITAIIALIPPSWEFSLYYIHSLDDFNEYRGWMVEKIAIYSVILYLLLAVSHLVAIVGLAWHMNHSDYVHVFLFLSSIFLTFVVLWFYYHYKFAENIKEIRNSSVAKKIDEIRENKTE